MSPRLDSWWSGSFSLPGREFHPLEAPGLSWRTKKRSQFDPKVFLSVIGAGRTILSFQKKQTI
jgi:hypothetical protein